MRRVPERSPWLQLATVFGAFLLGPWAGLQTGLLLAPQSDVVQTVSVFAFALVFLGGTLVWTGVGIASVVLGGLWNLVRGRWPGPASLQPSDRFVPPGYRAYIVLGCGAGGAVGLLAGIVTGLTIFEAAAAWTVVGALYGLLLWAAAHHGSPMPASWNQIAGWLEQIEAVRQAA
jgi:hypothetical protein